MADGRLLLSSLVGRPVLAADGSRVGRAGDLTVLLGAAHPPVHRLAVGSPRRISHLLPWSWVADPGPEAVRLREGTPVAACAVHEERLALETQELLLARDVMDTEVVDLAGHRQSRVSDVLLVGPANGVLEVAAVDVGVGGLLRRLGLRALARRLPVVAVDWQDLHLTSSRGHVVQLSTSTAGMHRLDSRGLAELLTRLSMEKATDVVRTVGPDRAAGAVDRAHPAVGRRLLHALGPEEADRLVAAAPAGATGRMNALRRHVPPIRRRRFLRLAGWRLQRPPHRAAGPGSGRGAGTSG